MKKVTILLFVAVLSLSLISCEKLFGGGDDPKPTEVTSVKFTFYSKISVNLPPTYEVKVNRISATVYRENTTVMFAFSLANAETREFRGDSAKMLLGKSVSVQPLLKVYNQGGPAMFFQYTPNVGFVKVANQNTYSFQITGVGGLN